MNWFKKNKDWLITLAVFLFFGITLLIYSIFFRDSERNKPINLEKEAPLTFELPQTHQAQSGDEPNEQPPTQISSFFLEPGPAELLEKLESLNYQDFKNETKELPGLKIMWPAYFFSVQKIENGLADILLDASESGFGVTLLTTIDTARYPQIMALERGTKIWLAAEITRVDPTGTGQFFLDTEYIRFDDYQPPQKPAKTQKDE